MVGEYLDVESGEYRRFDVTVEADGSVKAHSPILGLELRWESGLVRFWNPETQAYLPTLGESEEARLDAEAALGRSEAARLSVELSLNQSEAARQAAEAEVAGLRERIGQLEES